MKALSLAYINIFLKCTQNNQIYLQKSSKDTWEHQTKIITLALAMKNYKKNIACQNYPSYIRAGSIIKHQYRYKK